MRREWVQLKRRLRTADCVLRIACNKKIEPRGVLYWLLPLQFVVAVCPQSAIRNLSRIAERFTDRGIGVANEVTPDDLDDTGEYKREKRDCNGVAEENR